MPAERVAMRHVREIIRLNVNAGAKLRQPAGVKLHYLGRIVGVGFAAWLADLLGRASGQAPGPRSGALQARGLVCQAWALDWR